MKTKEPQMFELLINLSDLIAAKLEVRLLGGNGGAIWCPPNLLGTCEGVGEIHLPISKRTYRFGLIKVYSNAPASQRYELAYRANLEKAFDKNLLSHLQKDKVQFVLRSEFEADDEEDDYYPAPGVFAKPKNNCAPRKPSKSKKASGKESVEPVSTKLSFDFDSEFPTREEIRGWNEAQKGSKK